MHMDSSGYGFFAARFVSAIRNGMLVPMANDSFYNLRINVWVCSASVQFCILRFHVVVTAMSAQETSQESDLSMRKATCVIVGRSRDRSHYSQLVSRLTLGLPTITNIVRFTCLAYFQTPGSATPGMPGSLMSSQHGIAECHLVTIVEHPVYLGRRIQERCIVTVTGSRSCHPIRRRLHPPSMDHVFGAGQPFSLRRCSHRGRSEHG